MKKVRCYFLVLFFFTTLGSYGSTETKKTNKSDIENIIFDTDIGNDVDDVLALDMIYKYIDAGKVNLLGIMINKEGNYPPEFVDILNTWYGYKKIPIGIIHNGPKCEDDATNYAKAVCLLRNGNGALIFKRSLKDYKNLPNAYQLYRKLLSKQPDKSVTIVSTGFFTNLARLLDTSSDKYSPLNGRDLVAKKVKRLITMGGCFNNENLHEYNIVKDIKSAQKVFSRWPTMMVTSPFEVGSLIKYPGISIENDFKWTLHHPMVDAYKMYQKMPYDRPTWDLTAVLYAVEGRSYFNISPAGEIKVNDNGSTLFIKGINDSRYYLLLNSNQIEKIKKRFVESITKKPKYFVK